VDSRRAQGASRASRTRSADGRVDQADRAARRQRNAFARLSFLSSKSDSDSLGDCPFCCRAGRGDYLANRLSPPPTQAARTRPPLPSGCLTAKRAQPNATATAPFPTRSHGHAANAWCAPTQGVGPRSDGTPHFDPCTLCHKADATQQKDGVSFVLEQSHKQRTICCIRDFVVS
jgi:hypothetical protein